MTNYESPEVVFNGNYYNVGDWSFDEDDKDLQYIDKALEAWSRWRDYVVAEANSDRA